MTEVRIEIVSVAKNQVVHVVKIQGKPDARRVAKMENGVNINLDHDRYYTRVVGLQPKAQP